jgi:hypothetical protein
MNQGITIRLGAAQNNLSVKNGPSFDLAALTKTERYEVRRALIEGLKVNGYFGRKERRKAMFRQKREAAA